MVMLMVMLNQPSDGDGDGDGDVSFIDVGHLTLLVRTLVRCALEELMPIPGIKDHVHVHQVELDLVPRLLLLGICHFCRCTSSVIGSFVQTDLYQGCSIQNLKLISQHIGHYYLSV